MLRKYPGLTVVGGAAMAFAIGVGCLTFEVVKRGTGPSLPLPDGDRLVGLNYWDAAAGSQSFPSVYDYLTWEDELSTVELGAFRLLERNLTPDGDVGEPVFVAQITAVGFQMAGVSPRLGRALTAADEVPGAPDVVVLGHRLWELRFASDPQVVGRTIRLGGAPTTVVGVMPEGFSFPVADDLWAPLRTAELPQGPGQAELRVFGRLTGGTTLAQAQAELETIFTRSIADQPEEYERLAPQVLPYAESIIWLPPDLMVRAGILSVNVLAGLFLFVTCGNVALMMFARAATREAEILVRAALGAARSQIVGLMFVEALVLAALSAVVGLGSAGLVLDRGTAMLRASPDRWPFWFDGGLSVSTVLYALGLTMFAAMITGILPALKVLGPDAWLRMRQAAAGGGGLRMGKVWTGAIVAQVTATVLFTAVAYIVQRQAAHIAATEVGFPAEQYISARLEMDPESAASEAGDPADETFAVRYGEVVRELSRRLAAEPGVAGVTVAMQLPLMPSPVQFLEVEAGAEGESSIRASVRTGTIRRDFFEVFEIPIIAGRGLDTHDADEGANSVVVNELFVDRLLGGRSAVGDRVRFGFENPATGAEPGPWLEIVGVVRDLEPSGVAPLRLDNPAQPKVYIAMGDGAGGYPQYIAVRAAVEPRVAADRLRRIAASVSPLVRLHDVLPLDEATGGDALFWSGFSRVVALISGTTLFLALAGIYSITSFAVSRRTREVGVRLALGAGSAHVLKVVLRGPLLQVSVGVAVGCLLLTVVGGLATGASGAVLTRRAVFFAAYGVLMIAVCLLACVRPALRVLELEPTEALGENPY
jgi:predicted permease